MILFDKNKSDVEYLMLDGIQKKSYRNLEEIYDDMFTYFEFKFPIDTFKEELEQAESYFGMAYPTREKFLNYFVQSELVEEWWDIMKCEKFDFSCFNQDKEYLFKNGLSFRQCWQNEMSVGELIADNIPGKMTQFIEDWYWKRVDELSLRI